MKAWYISQQIQNGWKSYFASNPNTFRNVVNWGSAVSLLACKNVSMRYFPEPQIGEQKQLHFQNVRATLSCEQNKLAFQQGLQKSRPFDRGYQSAISRLMGGQSQLATCGIRRKKVTAPSLRLSLGKNYSIPE